MQTKSLKSGEVVGSGFAKFNGGEHLCVNVPDGHFTISARTSSGKLITFAFVPYSENSEAGCVDVKFHNSGRSVMNGDGASAVMQAIGFTVGSNTFDTRKIERESSTPTTLLTVLLADKHYLSA